MKLPLPIKKNAGLAAAMALALQLCGGLAMAEVVAVVSVKNPLVTLTKNQVADIFLGKVHHFPNGSLAVAIDQAEGVPARDEFYARFGDKSPAQLKAHWSKIVFTGRGEPPKEVANGAEVKRRIAENPSVIGYLEQSMVDGSVKVLIVP